MKTGLKIRKFASYLALVGIFVLLAPQTATRISKTAYAEEGARIEISGSAKSESTAINGIVNSGTIHFTDFIPLGANQQAHLIPVSTGGNIDYYEMRGWAWSDNLGWISFYCGEDGLNIGAACGPYPYSVRFDADGNIMSGTDSVDLVTQYSWAWNTATGWISFSGENHDPDVVFPDYGVYIDLLGNFHGYAWSPTIGYIDFEGPTAEFTDTPTPEDCDLTPGVCVKINSVIPGNEVIADGVDYHEVYVYIKDANLNPIEKADIVSGEYRVRFYMEWEDTLKSLQAPVVNESVIGEVTYVYTPAGNALHNENTPFWSEGEVYGGVLSKPVVMYSQGSSELPVEAGIIAANKENLASIEWIPAGYTPETDPGADTSDDGEQLNPQMVFLIKSVAPSSDMNYSLTTEGVKVLNEDLSTLPENVLDGVIGLDGVDDLEPNKLAFHTVSWQIEKEVTPGVYESYPEVSDFKKYYAVDSNYGPINLPFKPALFVSDLIGPGPIDDDKYSDQLVLYRNTPMSVKLGVDEAFSNGYSQQTQVNLNSNLAEFKFYLIDNQSSEFEILYSNSYLGDMATLISEGSAGYLDTSKKNIVYYKLLPQENNMDIGINALIRDIENNLPDYFEQGAGILTAVEYTPIIALGDLFNFYNPVTYFSNHLPRVIGSGVFNPGVEIQGTNYSQGSDVESVQEGVNISSVGDININIVRDYIYKRVKQLTTNETLPARRPKETVSSINTLKTKCGTSYFPTCHRFEMPNNEEYIYYFRTNDLVLNKGGNPIAWSGADNVTIIVENGNIHIEGDLESSPGKKLALVALRDKSADPLGAISQAKVGHIYVGPNVKRIYAFMYGDGTLFSSYNFTGPDQYTPDGEPINLDYFDFDKQLLIVGGLSTRNCIGCVDFAENYYYTPVRQLSLTPAHEATARLYDLNYLRSFSLGIATIEGSPVDLQCGIPMSTEDFENQCPDSTIDPLNTFSEGGDLAALSEDDYAFDVKDGDKLIIEGLADGSSIIKTDKKNPLYIIYSPVNPKSFIFGEDKDLTF